MNRMGLVSIIIAFILALCAFSMINLYQTKNDLLEQIEQIETALSNPTDYQYILDKTQALANSWEEAENHMMRFIRNNEIDNTSVIISEAISFAKNKEYHLLDASLKKLSHLISHIWQTELPILQNLL